MIAREAFERVCESIAQEYEKKEWKYLKSKHQLKMVVGDLVFLVSFYSSYRNISDISVIFEGGFRIVPRQKKAVHYLGIGTSRYEIAPKGDLYPLWNVADEEGGKCAVRDFLEWSEKVVFPLVDEFTSNRDEFVRRVAYEGFPVHLKEFFTDVEFVLLYGSRELAEVAAKKYYESLDEKIRESFRTEYNWLMAGNEKTVTEYGKNSMLNHSNFRTIIENKIYIDFESTEEPCQEGQEVRESQEDRETKEAQEEVRKLKFLELLFAKGKHLVSQNRKR